MTAAQRRRVRVGVCPYCSTPFKMRRVTAYDHGVSFSVYQCPACYRCLDEDQCSAQLVSREALENGEFFVKTLEHTEGKIAHEDGDIYAVDTGNVNGYQIAICDHKGTDYPAGVIQSNADRLVACWNACEHISTADLIAGTRRGLVRTLQDLTAAVRQRDELLAVLRDIVDSGSGGDVLRDLARSAIEACDTMALPDDNDQPDQPTEAKP